MDDTKLAQLKGELAKIQAQRINRQTRYELTLKHPPEQLAEVLDDLTAAGVIARWWPTVYEPEIVAFGGPAGMRTVHDLFCADTQGVLTWLRQKPPGLGRRELSVLLFSGLLRGAGLDGFECGDV